MSCKDCAMLAANGGKCFGLAEVSGHIIRPVFSVEQAEQAADLFEPKTSDCKGFIAKQKIVVSQQCQIVALLISLSIVASAAIFSGIGYKIVTALGGAGLFVASARAYKDDGKYEAKRISELVVIMESHHQRQINGR